MAKKKNRSKTKRGPKPETLKIEGDWKAAVKTALERGKPAAPKKGGVGRDGPLQPEE